MADQTILNRTAASNGTDAINGSAEELSSLLVIEDAWAAAAAAAQATARVTIS